MFSLLLVPGISWVGIYWLTAIVGAVGLVAVYKYVLKPLIKGTAKTVRPSLKRKWAEQRAETLDLETALGRKVYTKGKHLGETGKRLSRRKINRKKKQLSKTLKYIKKNLKIPNYELKNYNYDNKFRLSLKPQQGLYSQNHTDRYVDEENEYSAQYKTTRIDVSRIAVNRAFEYIRDDETNRFEENDGKLLSFRITYNNTASIEPEQISSQNDEAFALLKETLIKSMAREKDVTVYPYYIDQNFGMDNEDKPDRIKISSAEDLKTHFPKMFKQQIAERTYEEDRELEL